MASANVLVIEDNPRIGQKLVEVLRRNGFAAELSLDGADGLTRAATGAFDIVLVEYLVPGVTGGRFIDHLRTQGGQMPVVVMGSSPRIQGQLAKRGADYAQGFLLKPFRVPELMLAVEQALTTVKPVSVQRRTIDSGTHETFSMTNLMVEFSRTGRTGVLRLERDGIKRAVYLLSGLPVFAESNLLNETFGRYLLERGIIERAEYAAVQNYMTRHNVRQGEALQSLGILDSDDVYSLLRGQVRERIIRCFDWSEADWSFEEDGGFIDDKLLFPMNPMTLLVEATARRHTPQELQAWFDRFRSHRVEMQPLAEALGAYIDRLQREPVLREVLALRPTVGAVAEALALVEARTAAILYMLEQIGALSLLTPFVSDAPGAALPAQATCPGPTELVIEDPRLPPEATLLSDPPPSPGTDRRGRAVLAHYLHTRGGDHFVALGVPRSADDAAITEAWIRLSRDFHPDAFAAHTDPEVQARVKEIFLQAAMAFGVLVNPAARAAYLATLPSHTYDTPGLAAEAAFAQGEQLLNTQAFVRARDAFTEAHRAVPSEPLYEIYLGWAMFLAADNPTEWRAGEAALNRGVSRDPSAAIGYRLLAELQIRMGRSVEAAGNAARAAHIEAQTHTSGPS